MRGEILYADIIKWLTSTSKEDESEKLRASLLKKQEFVVYFLNSVREQSAKVNQGTINFPLQNDKAVQSTENKISVQGVASESCEEIAKQFEQNAHFDTSNKMAQMGQLEQFPALVRPKSQTDKPNLRFQSHKHSSSRRAPNLISQPYKINAAGLEPQRRNKTVGFEISHQRCPQWNISDPSEFPSIGESAVRNKRITPTRVLTKSGDTKIITPHSRNALETLQQKENTPLQTNPIFSGTNPDFITPILEDRKPRNFDQERELLRKERSKFVPTTSDSSEKPIYLDSSALLAKCVAWTPSLEEVTSREQLDGLVRIYDCIFQENYVPNIVSELYCILSLLNCKHPSYARNPNEGIQSLFHNGHNCVYFAAHVLLNLRRIICMLDKSTVGLLSDNSRIELFCPPLHYFLNNIYETILPLELLNNTGGNFIGNVAFAVNTDNRENFVSENEFCAFRKQRDTFYELLRQWEANHQSSTWLMRSAQSDRIRMLVNLSKQPFTCTHFARLFISQLIIASSGECVQPDDDIPPAEVLSLLQKTNPNKYLRLWRRLVGSSDSRGPCPRPCFPLSQEFFKDFIVLASSPVFNQHLIDCLTTKIFELDEKYSQGFNGDEGDDGKSDCRVNFLACVGSLRILAKFLGFITFLPYSSNGVLPQQFISAQVALRKRSLPPINFATLLKSGRLVTLVWIVEFFAMMDSCSIQLFCYKRVLTMLWLYYRSPMLKATTEKLAYHQLFLLSLFGWLFEVVNLPGSFFSVTDDDEDGSENTLQVYQGDLDIIDQVVLYSFCPYWAELRTLLGEFAEGGFSQGSTVRKITPVSITADKIRSKSSAERQLQLKLEANFFSNNPTSVKKVVDFVADRLASNAIKDIFRKEVADAATKNDGVIKAVVEKQLVSNPDLLEHSNAVEFSDDCICNEIGKFITDAELYLKTKSSPALMLMLPEETTDAVLDMCTKIAFRLAMENVSLWAATPTTKQLFRDSYSKKLKELLEIVQDKTKGLKFEETVATKLGIGLPCPTDTIIKLKEMIHELFPSGVQQFLERNSVESVVMDVKILVQNRKDMVPQIQQLLIQLSVDLSIALVQTCPELMDSAMQEVFTGLWKIVIGDDSHLNRIISAKTVLLLQLSKQSQLSWKCWQDLVKNMLKYQLLHPSRFCDQCLNVLAQEFQWQGDTLRNFSASACEIMTSVCYDSDICDANLHGLLETKLNECITKSQLT